MKRYLLTAAAFAGGVTLAGVLLAGTEYLRTGVNPVTATVQRIQTDAKYHGKDYTVEYKGVFGHEDSR
jgi:hypothetical protein